VDGGITNAMTSVDQFLEKERLAVPVEVLFSGCGCIYYLKELYPVMWPTCIHIQVVCFCVCFNVIYLLYQVTW
jgi:hypothetical protein